MDTKTSKLKKLLEQCAELAGDDVSLLDFALAHPFFRKAAGPPKLFEPTRSKSAEVGDNPAARVKAAYGPPPGTLLRLDHLAQINFSLYKEYNTWACRNSDDRVERIITKTDYLALIARRMNSLGYTDDLLASVGVSLEKKKSRAKADSVIDVFASYEKWSERSRENSESPAAFTIRVYGKYLDNGFSRQTLRTLDRPLYDALSKLLERNDVPKTLKTFFNTPAVRRSSRIDTELVELMIKKPSDAFQKLPDDRKRAERLYQAALRRQPKNSSQ